MVIRCSFVPVLTFIAMMASLVPAISATAFAAVQERPENAKENQKSRQVEDKAIQQRTSEVVEHCRHIVADYDLEYERKQENDWAINQIQTITNQIPSMQLHQRACAIKAIDRLTKFAAADIFDQADENHKNGTLDDGVWIRSISSVAELLPKNYNTRLLEFLEQWIEKYPPPRCRSPDRNAYWFHIRVNSYELEKQLDFLQKCTFSKSNTIAERSIRSFIDVEDKLLERSFSSAFAKTSARHGRIA